MSKFIIKRNDTSPVMEARLLAENGGTVSLADATVVFNMRTKSGSVVINRQSVTIVDAASGIVRYSWSEADTERSGQYQGEFEVTFSGGQVETFPKSEKELGNFIEVIITDDIA